MGESITAESILQRFQRKESVLCVPLSDSAGAVQLKFRIPADGAEWQKIGVSARQFGAMAVSGRRPADWPAISNADVAAQAYWISALAVEPAFSHREALRMATECGALILYLWGQIQSEMAVQVGAAEMEAVDDLLEA